MTNKEGIDSSAVQSPGPMRFSKYRASQDPLKVKKNSRQSKVKFLAAEEVATLTSGTPTTKYIGRINLRCNRSQALTKPANSKCLPTTENANSSSLAPPTESVHVADSEELHLTSKIKKTQSTTKKGDGPGSNLALAVNAASSSNLALSRKKDFGVSSKHIKQKHTSDGRSKQKVNSGSTQGEAAIQIGWGNLGSKRSRALTKSARSKCLQTTENANSSSPAPPERAAHVADSEKFPLTSKIKDTQSTTEEGDGLGSNLALAVNASSSSNLVLPQKKIRVCNSDFEVSSKDIKQKNTSDSRSKQKVNSGSTQGEAAIVPGKETVCLKGRFSSTTLLNKLNSGTQIAKQIRRGNLGSKRSQALTKPASSKCLQPTENVNSSSPAPPKQAVHVKGSKKFHLTSKLQSLKKTRRATKKGDCPGNNSALAVKAASRSKLVLPRKKKKVSNPDYGISLKDLEQMHTSDGWSKQEANSGSTQAKGKEPVFLKGPFSLGTLLALQKFNATNAGEDLVHKSGPSEPSSPPLIHSSGAVLNNLESQEKFSQKILYDQLNFGADIRSYESQEKSSPKIVFDQLNLDVALNNSKSYKKSSPNIVSDQLNFGIDFSSPGSRERSSLKIVSNSSAPTLEKIWKGFFEILDIDTLQGITEEIRFCEGFSAHPAATANPKAYEFTKQIAGLMQFKLYPRSDVWHEIFKTDIADPNNIALYFYPAGIKSSKRKYSTLLKYMVKNDTVMKSRMGSVELMVLTSKLLPSDFQSEKPVLAVLHI
ncbi:uncharacterized protein LOC110428400 [Herrania umbratica]|uniref:Uncharacterized protein LOC110428400 n=1 Tax=Herrania umbratica TaxID=108875 RepID=A0A6J1BLF1_9ROSI|nr:uncharacterized protein LOC110428400 [Herrania umbratica]